LNVSNAATPDEIAAAVSMASKDAAAANAARHPPGNKIFVARADLTELKDATIKRAGGISKRGMLAMHVKHCSVKACNNSVGTFEGRVPVSERKFQVIKAASAIP